MRLRTRSYDPTDGRTKGGYPSCGDQHPYILCTHKTIHKYMKIIPVERVERIASSDNISISEKRCETLFTKDLRREVGLRPTTKKVRAFTLTTSSLLQ